MAATPVPAFTHQDLWLLPRVANPMPSPDGRWVVFSVTQPAYDVAEQTVDLWLVPTDGSADPRKITSTKGGEAGVDWSPDSSRLAFTAKREGDEVSQLYVLPLREGGEAQRLTQSVNAVRGPQWSPSGERVLFTSDVYPGALDEEANKKAAKARKERKTSARVYDSFPIRYWDKWLEEKKATLFVLELSPGGVPKDLLSATELAQKPGFGGVLGTTGEGFRPVWSPDGREVLFIATENRHEAAYAFVRTGLYAVPADGGEPRRLSDETEEVSGITFNAQGTAAVLEVSPVGTGKVYVKSRLMWTPWPLRAGARRELAANLDLAAEEVVFSPDGAAVYFTAEQHGYGRLFVADVATGKANAWWSERKGTLSELRGSGEGASFRLVALDEAATRPPEVVVITPNEAAEPPRAVTAFAAEKVKTWGLQELESFWIKSERGRDVQSFVVRPPGFDATKKYPAWAVIHGGPHSSFKANWGLRWHYGLLASPGYVLVLTNYTGSTGFGEAFAQAIQGDPLKTPGDEINQALAEAVTRYPFIDGQRLAAGGASYGGHLANWLQATTTHYRCLISHAGLVDLAEQWGTSDVIYSREVNNGGPFWENGPLWTEQSPARLAGNAAQGQGWKTPMLLTVGELDYRVPVNNTIMAWSLHQRLQIPSKLIVFPDENHWVLKGENSRFWYGEVHAWLARWLTP